MTAQTYTCRRFKSVGTFDYHADFAQASGHIKVRFDGHDDDAWQSVPFQVADCRHDRTTCEQMIARHFR